MSDASIMDTNPRIACIVGTRPELIKMAPVISALRSSGRANVICLHSGQHTDLANTAFIDMGLQADVCLITRRSNSNAANLFTSLYDNFLHVFAQTKPDAVLVHGDTSTAWAACMAAFYCGIPIGHVEAGLRCPTLAEPFPEEAHRRLIGRLASWHFAPTSQAAANLKSENAQGDILVCGNTAIDSILSLTRKWTLSTHKPSAALLAAWQPSAANNEKPFRLLITLHRRENRGTPLRNFVSECAHWLSQSAHHLIVWPQHANPELRAEIKAAVEAQFPQAMKQQVFFTPALCYADTVWALQHCNAVATDSGGLQEEASAFFKPLLILRNSTERPEAIEAGYASLIGCGQGRLPAAISRIQSGVWPSPPSNTAASRWPFGDGHAAQRITNHLLKCLQSDCAGNPLLRNSEAPRAGEHLTTSETT